MVNKLHLLTYLLALLISELSTDYISIFLALSVDGDRGLFLANSVFCLHECINSNRINRPSQRSSDVAKYLPPWIAPYFLALKYL